MINNDTYQRETLSEGPIRQPLMVQRYFFIQYTSMQILPNVQKFGNDLESFYASVKRNLELPLLKGRRRFDVETTSNLEVYIFRGWWILT